MDVFLPLWNLIIVGPVLWLLRQFASLFEGGVNPGLAAGLAILASTIVIRVVLLPLSLQQVRSQREMMKIQPLMKEIQRKFKNDREGLARAQMALYKEHGVNPAAGCLPLVVQMPVLFGMYAAMTHLATMGLTLDQVQPVVVDPQQGQIVYQATRTEDPLPVNAFVLARISVVPTTDQPVTLDIDDANSVVSYSGVTDSNLLVEAAGSLTLTPGQTPHNPNPPNTPDHKATLFLRPGGQFNPAGSVEPVDRSVQVQQGQPYIVEVWANSHLERVDSAKVVVTYPPDQLTVSAADVTTPQQSDLPFKSAFLWLPSLGEPDQIHVMGFALPGALLLLMTLSTFITSRMTTTQSDDPQQKAMMQMMSFMPLMYLFFFAATPAGLVLYWLVSNIFTLFQQFFTTGLGQLRYDLLRLTGRDLQPPWALQGTGHLTPAAMAQDDSKSDGKTPSAAGASRSKTNGVNGTSDSTVPGRPQRLANDRRTHPTVGRGRKRGKR